MKIFVVGEGPHDIGDEDWASRVGHAIQTDGWIQPILRKLLSGNLQFTKKRLKDIVLLPGHKHRPWPPGHGAKAKMAKYLAGGCDVLVFMTDADTADIGEWRDKHQEIRAGLDAVENGVHAVACVPMSTSESWLLCDNAAWSKISGTGQHCPSRPEHLWGKRDDPEGNHPKMYFKRVCFALSISDSRETRVLVAGCLDVDALRSKCPISFVAFENELEV
jgi:hypothetical protein